MKAEFNMPEGEPMDEQKFIDNTSFIRNKEGSIVIGDMYMRACLGAFADQQTEKLKDVIQDLVLASQEQDTGFRIEVKHILRLNGMLNDNGDLIL